MVIINEIFEEYRNNPQRQLLSDTLDFLNNLEGNSEKKTELINKIQKQL
jgi:hypothetical protein